MACRPATCCAGASSARPSTPATRMRCNSSTPPRCPCWRRRSASPAAPAAPRWTATKKNRSPLPRRGRNRCPTARSSSAPARRGWRRRGSWRNRGIGRWCWSAAGPCATASATCAPSTPAGRLTRRAITSSARAGPAPSATASSPVAAAGRTCAACCNCSPRTRASRRSSTTPGRTWAATASRPWSRRCAAASRRWAARSASPAAWKTSTSPTAGCSVWPPRRDTFQLPWRCWRSATAPATPTRCCCAAACRWSGSRSSSACASSIRRRRSTESSTARRRWSNASGRPTIRWWPTAGTTCSPSACAPAATSCRACRSRAPSAPTA